MRRAATVAASAVLSAGTAIRRSLYGAGFLRTRSLPAPVVSIGNLSAGGAGKTPLVEHVVRELRGLGARPVVLARGYGPRVAGTELNDEGCVLAGNLPDLPQYQDPDRFAAGTRALAEGAGDCFVLDDAFQHLQLARDLDIVVLDARDPFGGVRREGRNGLRRSGFTVITRAGRAAAAELAATRGAVIALSRGGVAITEHEPSAVVPLRGGEAGGVEAAPPQSLRGTAVFACAGIADPSSLVHTLRSLGARVLGSRGYPDHGLASAADLRPAFEEARRLGADRLVVTRKDAVKLGAAGAAGPLPVFVLEIRLAFREGEEDLRSALAAALEVGRRRAGA